MAYPSGVMDTLILILHPVFALIVIGFMLKQYRYRKRRLELRGKEAKEERTRHEELGERTYILAISVVVVGFLANTLNGLADGESATAIIPSHLHGWFGILGLILLTILVRKGRLTKAQREAGESFSLERERHGRASDIIVILMVIHAFLGFIYLFQLVR